MVTDIPFLIVPGMIFVGVGGLGLVIINMKVSHRLLCLYYAVLVGSCYSIFSLMCMVCRSLFILFTFGQCVVCSSIYGF